MCKKTKIRFQISWLAAEKRDHRAYANSEDPDQPSHPLFACTIQGPGRRYRTNSEVLDPTRVGANWFGASPFLYALMAFLSVGG